MANSDVVTQNTQNRVSGDENVIHIQDDGCSLQGLKSKTPGAQPSSDISDQTVILLGQSEGAELLSRYTVIEDSPLEASSSGRSSRGFSLGTRPRTQNTSGFAMPEKSADFYQQQLLQTQQLYFQQQSAISQLTATVNKLQKSIESSDKRSQVHNIRCTPPTRSSTVTLGDLSASDVSDCSLSSDRDGSNSADEVSVSSKRPRLDLEIRDRDGDRSKSKLDRIKDLGDKLGKDKLFAPDVHELVSTTVNQRLESCIDHKSEAVQDLLKKYTRPGNCEYLDIPKVNKTVWTSKQTSKDLKESDRLLQRTQTYLTKGIIPLVNIMDKTLKSSSEESNDLFDLALDSFSLLAFCHRDLSSQRRRLLSPAISSKYKLLCSESAPISASYLFGDSEALERQVKEIDEGRKLGNKINLNFNKPRDKSKGYNSSSKNTEYGQSRFKSFKSGDYGHPGHSQKDNFLSKKAQFHQTNRRKQQKKGELGHRK